MRVTGWFWTEKGTTPGSPEKVDIHISQILPIPDKMPSPWVRPAAIVPPAPPLGAAALPAQMPNIRPGEEYENLVLPLDEDHGLLAASALAVDIVSQAASDINAQLCEINIQEADSTT